MKPLRVSGSCPSKPTTYEQADENSQNQADVGSTLDPEDAERSGESETDDRGGKHATGDSGDHGANVEGS